MNAIVLPLLLVVVGLIDKPAPKLTLGKDTTYVNGPFDQQGYIDYEAALNAELSRGITRETNANVLLIAAFGPAPEGGNGLPPAYFRWIDMPTPPRDGEYYLSLGKIARDRLALTDVQLQAVFEQQSWAGARPWAAKDYPVIAEWLKSNEKTLALVHEAMKRTEYFNPLVSNRKDGEPSNLIGSLLPSVQKCRELAAVLTARAMLRVHEGKLDDAWQDILDCHRLGRFIARGATLIEGLVGIAIGAIASNTTLAYLEQAKLSSKQAAERLKDLRSLPPLPPLADKIELCERFTGLDSLQHVRRGGAGSSYLIAEIFGDEYKPSDEDTKLMEKLDWTPTMRTMNKNYDRLAAALRLKDRVAREKEFDKLDEVHKAVKKQFAEVGSLSKLLGKNPDSSVAKVIGEVFIALISPAIRKIQSAHDRAEQTERNLHVAFGMAAYHADHGRYPAKLDDLAPHYLAAVPGDLFAGKPLIYKPTEKGYLFYSVGPNGKDDGGRWYDDDPPGDDPRVRMPLPLLKKN